MKVEELASWRDVPSHRIRFGAKWLTPLASIALLGSLITRDHEGPLHHRISWAWTKLLASRYSDAPEPPPQGCGFSACDPRFSRCSPG